MTDADPRAILEAALADAKKPHKYHAKPTTYNGVRYDSKAEAEHAAVLDLAKRSGAIADYRRQVPLPIGEEGVDKPYRVDFVVLENDGSVHGEEVKGAEDSIFRRRKRQWAKRGPFPLWVIKGKHTTILPRGTEPIAWEWEEGA